MSNTEICFMTATQQSELLREKSISARELIEAHLSQIEKINPHVNAIVTLTAEQALEEADAADNRLAAGEEVGPLHGLPVAHKDLAETKGVRTTFGSLLFENWIPQHNTLFIDRIKAAGGISIGKTNVPEFGTGSQTFNAIFGATLNPYDLHKTSGGSSGGAAAALAAGMVPLADGSDLGGSLRNPAAFCNVVGFRVSPGRIPMVPNANGWNTLGVDGPMARTVEDVALLLSVMAGPDARFPASLSDPGEMFRRPLARDFSGTRISWSPGFGDLPVDPRVSNVIESHRSAFQLIGCQVEDALPDFGNADMAFKHLRAGGYATKYASLLDGDSRDKLKGTVIWNIEEGLKLSALDMGKAQTERTRIYHNVHRFMQDHEFMILPVTQVPPFDVTQEYVTEINGVKLETYLDWMRSCYYITILGLPAISVPCGFTPEGLPVGVQIVGRHNDDFGVLQLAYAFQEATNHWRQRPAPISNL